MKFIFNVSTNDTDIDKEIEIPDWIVEIIIGVSIALLFVGIVLLIF